MSRRTFPQGNQEAFREMTDITTQGLKIPTTDKDIFFPSAELQSVGCRNCVWRIHNQCPYDIKEGMKYHGPLNKDQPDGEKVTGICPDMLHFLGSLAGKDGTTSSIMENFLIYKTRLQESEDYKEFWKLKTKVESLELELKHALRIGDKEEIKSKSYEYESAKMDFNAAKVWWSKMNQNALFAIQKMRDREVKVQAPPQLPGIHGAKTVNFISLQNTDQIKQLEKNEDP